ncbi:hypothetical protein TSAR_009152 [Trichomalopsis sarcophagae]|uniref:C-type lectin domain-containing protein n=1 Tax=Trichomalopsis sarcophagae TaxID=543379 RepID=A0A232FEJ4_9HYME|nr:hypothetical protein TSAR_009152 [Trichomalopsis sarcophagae]
MTRKTFLLFITVTFAYSQTTHVHASENSTSVKVQDVISDLQRSIASLKRLEESSFNVSTAESSQKREELTRLGYICSEDVGWHKLHTTRKTWNRARRSCEDEDAHLAIVNSIGEAQVLSERIKKAGIYSVFIGIHDQFEEGDWVTVVGGSINKTGYVRWSEGLPNNYQTYNLTEVAANCGTMNYEGAFMDVYCYKKYAYICEYPLISINC